jgi:hypothetical protein
MDRNTILGILLIVLVVILLLKYRKTSLGYIFGHSENLENSPTQKLDTNEILYREIIKGGITDNNTDIMIRQKEIDIFDTHYKIKENHDPKYHKLIVELETINPYDLLILGKDYDYVSEFDTLEHHIIVKGVDIDPAKLDKMAHSNDRYAHYKDILDNVQKYINIVKHKNHNSW